MMPERFAYIWQYEIKPTCRSDFLKAYNPDGEWAALFSKDTAYLGTLLLRDAEDENGYVTIDYWVSQSDRDSFRARYSAEFDDLDRKCEDYTVSEKFVGDYVEVGESDA